MSSHKHGLAGLVDDVVVDPAVIRDVMYGVIAYKHLRRLKCWFKRSTAPVKDGEFTKASDSDPPYRGGNLTKTAKKQLHKPIAEQS